jgi:hypothetical protein
MGSRLRLWKTEIQKLADEIQIPISICHFPPGTSKWNKIDHRLFSFISVRVAAISYHDRWLIRARARRKLEVVLVH